MFVKNICIIPIFHHGLPNFVRGKDKEYSIFCLRIKNHHQKLKYYHKLTNKNGFSDSLFIFHIFAYSNNILAIKGKIISINL